MSTLRPDQKLIRSGWSLVCLLVWLMGFAVYIVQADSPEVMRVSLNAEAQQLQPGETTTITITLFDAQDQPLENGLVSLFASWGELSTASGLSDSQGRLTATFTAGNQPSQATITVLAGYESQSTTIEVLPNQINQPPVLPHTPNPSDNTSDLSVIPPLRLSWLGGDPDNDVVSYKFAFGRSNPPEIIANSLLTQTYLLNQPLTPGSYYWAVTATDGVNETEGPTWRFTIDEVNEPVQHLLYIPVILRSASTGK